MSDVLLVAVRIQDETNGILDKLVNQLKSVDRAAGTDASQGIRTFSASAQAAVTHSDGLGGSLRRVAETATGVGAAFGLMKLTGVFQSGIKGASDMAESLSKVKVVFGESAKGIEDWAKNAAINMGQSTSAAYSAAGAFGNFFVTLGTGQEAAATMSKQMVELAGDLASFHNADPSEVITAMMAAFRGESEPIARFGVLMNEATLKTEALKLGLIDTDKGALSPAIKTMAAYSLILSQTGTAQGDFARTADGNANQMRILNAQMTDIKNTMGTALLPIVVKVGQAFVEAMPYGMKAVEVAIATLRPYIVDLINVLKAELPGAIVTVNGAISTLLSGMATVIDGASGSWVTLSTVIAETMSGILSIVSTVGEAIYVAMGWLNPFVPHSPPLVDQVRDGLAIIRDEYSRLSSITDELESVSGAVMGFGEAMAGVASTLEAADMANTLEAIARTGGPEAVASFQAASAALQTLQVDYDNLGIKLGETQANLDLAGVALDSERIKLQDLGNAVQDAKNKFDDFRNTPLLEEQPFNDALDKINTAMKKVQLEIAKAKLGGASEESLKGLQGTLEKLRLQAESIRLEKDLKIDPLKDKLDDLTKEAPKPFDEILKGAQGAQADMVRLGKEYDAQNNKVKEQTDAYEVLKKQLEDQKEAYAALGTAIQGQNSVLQQYVGIAKEAVQQEEARARAATAAAKAAAAAGGAGGAVGITEEQAAKIAEANAKATEKAEEMKAKFSEISEKLTEVKDSFRDMADSAGELAASVRPVTNFFTDIENVKPIIIGVAIGLGILAGAVIALTAAITLMDIATKAVIVTKAAWAAIQTVLNVVMSANPVMLIVVAVGLLVAGIALLIIHWDKIIQKFPILGTIADGVKSAFDTFLTWVTGTLAPKMEEIYEIVRDPIKSAVEAAEPIIEGFQIFFGTQIKIAVDAVRLILALFKGDWDGVWREIKNIVSDAWTGIKEFTSLGIQAIQDLVPKMVEAGKALGGALKDGIIDALDKALSLTGDLANALIGVLESALNFVIEKINRAVEFRIEVLGVGKDINPPDIPPVNIPRFSKGGFASKPTLAIVGDSPGGEYMIPANSGMGRMIASMSRNNGIGDLIGQSGRGGLFSGLQGVIASDSGIKPLPPVSEGGWKDKPYTLPPSNPAKIGMSLGDKLGAGRTGRGGEINITVILPNVTEINADNVNRFAKELAPAMRRELKFLESQVA